MEISDADDAQSSSFFGDSLRAVHSVMTHRGAWIELPDGTLRDTARYAQTRDRANAKAYCFGLCAALNLTNLQGCACQCCTRQSTRYRLSQPPCRLCKGTDESLRPVHHILSSDIIFCQQIVDFGAEKVSLHMYSCQMQVALPAFAFL